MSADANTQQDAGQAPPEKKQKTEEVDSQGHSKGSSGVDNNSGTPYQPLPLQRYLGNRKTRSGRFVYSGTTFIGPASGGADGEPDQTNVWYRFPWEFTQSAIRAWESWSRQERWLFWRAHKIGVEFKNPIIIQDQVTGADLQAVAGQNLHAQIFGYQDNLYMTGVAQSYSTGTETNTGNTGDELSQQDVETLLRSFGNHGYDATGNVVRLPKVNVSRNSFQHNFPDVKQMGMGGGNSISYGWNMTSPYWRSTMEFYNKMQIPGTDPTIPDFDDTALVRWDEQFGRVGLAGNDGVDDDYEGPVLDPAQDTNCTNANGCAPAFIFRGYKRNMRESLSVTDPNGFWKQTKFTMSGQQDDGTVASSHGFNVYYRDPEPIPKVYLQLQPQLSAIEIGTGNAVAQIQFEVHIDYEMMGQCPSILEATSVTEGGESRADEATYGRRWTDNIAYTVPIFYPIMTEELFDGVPQSRAAGKMQTVAQVKNAASKKKCSVSGIRVLGKKSK